MSNLWLNLRIFYWHIQVGPDRPWVRITFNDYHWQRRPVRPRIELY